jgi:hypothetical protein
MDVGKVFPIGSQSLSLQVGAYYNVKKPDGAADWCCGHRSSGISDERQQSRSQ